MVVTIPARPTNAATATVVIDAVTAPSALQRGFGQWSRNATENKPIIAPAATVSTVATISRSDTVTSVPFDRGGGGGYGGMG